LIVLGMLGPQAESIHADSTVIDVFSKNELLEVMICSRDRDG